MTASNSIEGAMQTLRRLGLTENQGKVFLSLQQIGSSTAKNISQASGVKREKVYTILLSLQELGLVKKGISAPATFEALHLGDVAKILLGQKRKDYDDLRNETNQLVQNFKVSSKEDLQSSSSSKLVLVPKKEAFILRTKASIENATKSIDWATTWRRFSRISMLGDELKEAQNKGVVIRFLVTKPKHCSSLPDLLRSVKIPLSQCKTTSTLPAIAYVYDDTKAAICTSAETGLMGSPAVFTDNACFVAVVKNYFERIWANGQPVNDCL